jgi:hypothetical protein
LHPSTVPLSVCEQEKKAIELDKHRLLLEEKLKAFITKKNRKLMKKSFKIWYIYGTRKSKRREFDNNKKMNEWKLNTKNSFKLSTRNIFFSSVLFSSVISFVNINNTHTHKSFSLSVINYL